MVLWDLYLVAVFVFLAVFFELENILDSKAVKFNDTTKMNELTPTLHFSDQINWFQYF